VVEEDEAVFEEVEEEVEEEVAEEVEVVEEEVAEEVEVVEEVDVDDPATPAAPATPTPNGPEARPALATEQARTRVAAIPTTARTGPRSGMERRAPRPVNRPPGRLDAAQPGFLSLKIWRSFRRPADRPAPTTATGDTFAYLPAQRSKRIEVLFSWGNAAGNLGRAHVSWSAYGSRSFRVRMPMLPRPARSW
jgi:hypothetical protein